MMIDVISINQLLEIMKSIVISIVMLITGVTTLQAAVPLKIDIVQLSTKIGIQFKIDTPSPDNIVITLRDHQRNVIFQKAYHGSNHYRGTVNLEAAEDGKYYLEVRQGAESLRRQIYLTREDRRLVRLDE